MVHFWLYVKKYLIYLFLIQFYFCGSLLALCTKYLNFSFYIYLFIHAWRYVKSLIVNIDLNVIVLFYFLGPLLALCEKLFDLITFYFILFLWFSSGFMHKMSQ